MTLVINLFIPQFQKKGKTIYIRYLIIERKKKKITGPKMLDLGNIKNHLPPPPPPKYRSDAYTELVETHERICESYYDDQTLWFL